ncbi:hypothetical protein J6590_034312 [Homalodisca vitripennis]|nr:hypothetical protein J6590_034312 [Homalodisca vitripennis]
MKIWDPAYDPYSSLLDQKCMFCRGGSTPDLNPIRQQRSETPVVHITIRATEKNRSITRVEYQICVPPAHMNIVNVEDKK